MSIKEKAIEVLFDDDKNNTSRGPNILLPSNRWTRYHQLEHEYIHADSIDSVFKNTIGLDLSRWISCVTDFGYGDISCNLNYWLWLNELRPIKIKILVDDTHYKKSFDNKETTIDKIEYLIHKQWQSNIEYQYVKIRRSFGNILRTYKSAFRGKSLMKHTDRNYRRMWAKYVPVNLEQYWFVPLSMQMEWFPSKSQWVRPKEKSVVIYRYSPPKDWNLIDNYSFANIGDKMISQDKKEVDAYWSSLEKALKKAGYNLEYLTYSMTPNQLFTKISKATMLVSSRGGFSYLAQHIGTPTVTIFPPRSMVLHRDYSAQHCQFHNKAIRLFDPIHIADVDIDDLSTRSTIQKSNAYWKVINYNTLEKMQKLESDVDSFNSHTAVVYKEAQLKDANKATKADLSNILPIKKKVEVELQAENAEDELVESFAQEAPIKKSIKEALTKVKPKNKPKKKASKKTRGKK